MSEVVNVDPGQEGWYDFLGTGLEVEEGEIVKGVFECMHCGKKGLSIDSVWEHFKKEHYDKVLKEYEETHKAFKVEILENELSCVYDKKTGVGQLLVLPTFIPFKVKAGLKEFIYDKPVCGVSDQNLGKNIQKYIEKAELLPDTIDVWRSEKTGKLGFKFGYEDEV